MGQDPSGKGDTAPWLGPLRMLQMIGCPSLVPDCPNCISPGTEEFPEIVLVCNIPREAECYAYNGDRVRTSIIMQDLIIGIGLGWMQRSMIGRGFTFLVFAGILHYEWQ
jgi:hypothetical protein